MSTAFECPPEHKHEASGTCYVIHRCRCADCRAGRAAAERRRSRLKAYGRYDNGLTDAEPVREHIHMLQAFGYGWKRIATLSGVGETAIESLIYGRKGGAADPRKGEILKRTPKAKADAILAVKPDMDSLAGGARIPSRGVHRRVQALVTRGWSQSKIAAKLNIDRGNFWTLMTASTVTVRRHREVASLYEELWNTEPPRGSHREKVAYSRAVNYAKARRWLPPLAWDDIDNDATPPVADEVGGIDEMVVELAVMGEKVRLSPEERRECVRRLHAARWSDQRIAESLGCADRTVLRIREELGLAAFDFADLQKRGAA